MEARSSAWRAPWTNFVSSPRPKPSRTTPQQRAPIPPPTSQPPIAELAKTRRLIPDRLDIGLLPGENPDLKTDILNSLGEAWLTEANVRLWGLAPRDLLGTSNEPLVRDLWRSILVVGLT